MSSLHGGRWHYRESTSDGISTTDGTKYILGVPILIIVGPENNPLIVSSPPTEFPVGRFNVEALVSQ